MNKKTANVLTFTSLSLIALTANQSVLAQNKLSFINHKSTNFLLTQNNENVKQITDLLIEENDNQLSLTIVTQDGKSIVPLIMREENRLVIDLVDSALQTDIIRVNPTANIAEISLKTLDDSTVRLTIISNNNRNYQAQIIPSDRNLILGISERNFAQNLPNLDDITITITGTRTARSLLDSANSITIIDSQQIERQLINDIQDLVRYEPGVSVGRNANRFGNQDFNIRGIDGNRVLLQVDGISVPDNYVGRGRDYFNLETTRRVEIIKGPASALYGSDAIGGVVSFITKDPQDYLNTFGNSFYSSGQIGYDTSSELLNLTGVIAGEDEDGKLQFSAVASFTDGSELKTVTGAETNPQKITGYSLTSKLVYNFDENSSLKFTGEFLRDDVDTVVLNEIGSTPFNVRPPNFIFFDRQEVNADDTRSRNRLSLDYNYQSPNPSWLENLNAKIYYQNANIKEKKLSVGIQQSFGQEQPSFRPVTRDELNQFKQDIFGAELQLQSDFNTGRASHRLVYGVDFSQTSTSRPRDNTLIFADGTTSKFVVGETFPNKTFPDTDTTRLGLYLQDEIEIGRFSIIPAIRWDYFGLNAKEDDDFRRINVDGFTVENRSDSAFSPKIGIVYKPRDELALYGQYARGFRSPPYDDANIGFTNFAFGYAVLPNANLKPEKSNSFEVGIRGNYPQFNFSLAGFYNDYEDFIDTVNVGTRADGFQQFQSQNIDSARIYGIEAKTEYFFNPDKTGFSVLGSLAWAVGDSDSGSGFVPLNSVNPFEAVLGVRYRADEDKWGTQLLSTFVGAKSADRIDGENLFAPDGYVLLDLISYYNFSPNTSLNVGLFNLFNTEYFSWSDVRGLTADNANLPRYAPPGFNMGVNFIVRF
ncbi:MAG: TonB-dependent hemoglobin/transferrin/lactoferrin family receptor [Cyanobacterium sp. T60_A2020_053]|nr:TonB-dependent hemoglobin/transferrin/lactoferrin family receptor [Cyanobacterium sp. T60_A2020_053]